MSVLKRPPRKSRSDLRRHKGAVATALLCAALAQSGAAQAQSSSAAKPDPPAASDLKLGPIKISGDWRVRVEGWDWFEPNTGENAYVFPHSLLRIAISQQTERIDWKLEASQDTIIFLPRNAVLAAPQGQLGLGGTYYAANENTRNNIDAFIKQAYFQINHLGKGKLKLGRFEYFDGAEVKPQDATLALLVQTRISQRLLGNYGFSAVQRSYDGGEFDYNFGKANVTLLGGYPTQGVYQIDGMGQLNINVYYGALTVPTRTENSSGELRLFGLGYIDHRADVLKTDNRPQAIRAADHGQIHIGTYGGNYLHVFNTQTRGKFDFLIWGAAQTGAWGRLAQSAGAFVGEFGWQPPVETLKPWLSAGYSYGSGDDNPTDSVHGTFFQVLPTPRMYARMPFYNMENNEDLYGSLNLRAGSKLAIRSEWHALRLANRRDLWYLGGGAYQPQTFGYTGRPSGGNQGFANVWDLSADYQVTRSFALGLYYAHAWGKAVIAGIYPKDRNGQFAYIETNFRF